MSNINLEIDYDSIISICRKSEEMELWLKQDENYDKIGATVASILLDYIVDERNAALRKCISHRKLL